MKVAIIKYNAGNIQSVIYALNRLGVEPDWTDDPEKIAAADKVIFPGVGEATSTMTYLNNKSIADIIKGLEQPTLGICIGQQLMCQHSAEGDVPCLDIFPLNVLKFNPTNGNGEKFKVPHMGWNKLEFDEHPLFANIDPEHAYVYYVHSYYAEIDPDYTIATSSYVVPYSAALQKDQFYSVQFHPEKSGEVGAQVLKNFLEL